MLVSEWIGVPYTEQSNGFLENSYHADQDLHDTQDYAFNQERRELAVSVLPSS
jgi:hypothetical protein